MAGEVAVVRTDTPKAVQSNIPPTWENLEFDSDAPQIIKNKADNRKNGESLSYCCCMIFEGKVVYRYYGETAGSIRELRRYIYYVSS